MNKNTSFVILEIDTGESIKINLIKEFFGIRGKLLETCSALQERHSPIITIRFFIHTLQNGNKVGAYEFISNSTISHVAICCGLDQIISSLECACKLPVSLPHVN